MENFNIKKLTFFSGKLTLIILLLSLFLIPNVRAPPLPPSPSTNSSFIVSTSSIVHTSSTISSSHALISPSPPLFNEDVDSSSAVNNNESNYILYLVDYNWNDYWM
ncbi:17324_t:CDS:2 [Entrophospora sp. SA101]|nr:17324_t:CDS:2 [Entrophospora sp. SA101]